MTQSDTLIDTIDELLNHHTDVHKEHVEALKKRLKHKKVKHVVRKKSEDIYTFGYRPEYAPMFSSCCHDVQSASTSTTPVCAGENSTAGGVGGAMTSSVDVGSS